MTLILSRENRPITFFMLSNTPVKIISDACI